VEVPYSQQPISFSPAKSPTRRQAFHSEPSQVATSPAPPSFHAASTALLSAASPGRRPASREEKKGRKRRKKKKRKGKRKKKENKLFIYRKYD
jgi:hypothetical protein